MELSASKFKASFQDKFESFKTETNNWIETNADWDKAMSSVRDVEAKAEKYVLNPISWVPFYSWKAAWIRGNMGIAQILFFGAMAYRFHQQINEAVRLGDVTKIQDLTRKRNESVTQVWHGVCNFFRSGVEAVPILGNIAVIFYDFVLKHRVKYEGEGENEVTPLVEKHVIPQAKELANKAKAAFDQMQRDKEPIQVEAVD